MSWAERNAKDASSMSDSKQANAMLPMAQRDFKALHGMLDAEIFADEIYGFHVRQAGQDS